ncbi:hypothetical protein LR48_Vigan08g049000 [Vigna angularis]|uniref:SHSP domain-containing protein n=2 Tax=Phaseolus angularis TaxID=3914 RepID=A0A0L9V3R2_PHAAN|nr:hypothetical protein LR48_Vigan08g049000 [Vigna angularis]
MRIGQPKLETEETAESHSLLVHLPGYAEDDIGAEFEYDYRRVRVFGRRSLGDNRSIRFNIAYAVPMNCDVNKLKGVFQGEIFSIIMPKVTIPRKVQGQIMKTCEEPKSIVESQIQANEALTSPKSDSVPQKGEGVSQDAKNQREVSFESSEKKRVERKETKDESENDSVSGKPPQKGKNEGVMDETSSITRSGKLGDIECKIGERKGKEKVEMNSKIGDIGSSERIGIKEVAATASQAVTSLIKGFNEEDKHVLLYTSVTVLVFALGVYASYKLRSLAK